MPQPNIRDFMLATVQRTGNPVAPLIINKLNNSLGSAVHLFIKGVTKEQVEEIQRRLLADFKDEDKLNNLCSKPEFILALITLLETSLVAYGVESAELYR